MISGEIVIRETVPADLAAIVEVHKKGFGYDKEAGLTAELLSDPTAGPAVSLLALRDGEAVGHILFTRCRIAGAEPDRPLFYILAPLAVVPSCQKQGVGRPGIAQGIQPLVSSCCGSGARNSSSYSDTRSTTRATDSFPVRKNWDSRLPTRSRKNTPTTGWHRR